MEADRLTQAYLIKASQLFTISSPGLSTSILSRAKDFDSQDFQNRSSKTSYLCQECGQSSVRVRINSKHSRISRVCQGLSCGYKESVDLRLRNQDSDRVHGLQSEAHSHHQAMMVLQTTTPELESLNQLTRLTKPSSVGEESCERLRPIQMTKSDQEIIKPNCSSISIRLISPPDHPPKRTRNRNQRTARPGLAQALARRQIEEAQENTNNELHLEAFLSRL